MDEVLKSLSQGIERSARRREAVRYIGLAGSMLFVGSVALVAFWGVRVFLAEIYAVWVGPVSPTANRIAAAAALVAAVLAIRLVVVLRPVAHLVVAREADRNAKLADLLAAALAAERQGGPVAEEVVRQAAKATDRIDPRSLYPAARALVRTAVFLAVALAAVYLSGILPFHNPDSLPIFPGSGGTDTAAAPSEDEPDPEEAEDPEDEPDPEEGEPDPEESPAKPDEVLVKVVPSKLKYKQNERVTLFITADPGDSFAEEHTLAAHLVLDEEAMTLRQDVTVKPGPKGGALLVIEARDVPVLGQKLTPGKHKVAAFMKEGERMFVSEPVEIEIEGDPGGDNKPKPEPKPDPQAGGPPPPPEANFNERFVTPLFNEGETIKKKGWALVPDPDAPPGSPPRRMPLDAAAKEAARRPESAVPTERLRPGDREDVARYFELLRRAR